MSRVLLLGYPPIPFSKDPVLVAAEGEVNAVIDKHISPHPHFILSAVPRSGFSGGPAISEHGFLLGVLTESLGKGGEATESGFFAAISIEPLLALLHDNGIAIRDNENILFEI
jgi:hypothetical protein